MKESEWEGGACNESKCREAVEKELGKSSLHDSTFSSIIVLL